MMLEFLSNSNNFIIDFGKTLLHVYQYSMKIGLGPALEYIQMEMEIWADHIKTLPYLVSICGEED